MNIEIQEINSVRKNIVATFSAEEIKEKQESILKDFASQARVAGFRPGKAPIAVVQKTYAKGIKEETCRKLTQAAYEKAVEDNSLKVASIVEVKDEHFFDKNNCEIVVDTVPKFDLPEYKGIEVTVEPEEVTEEDIQKAIDTLLNQRAEYKVVEREVQKGDYAKVSYEGTIDGKPIAEIAPNAPMYGKQTGTWEEAGSEGPGVSSVVNGIIGMKKGDKKDIAHDFAKDFEKEELAGKKATYVVEVLEVREKVVPPMDEAFFKQNKVADEAELRENLKKGLEQQKKNHNLQARRTQILDKLTATVKFDLPESVVAAETSDMVEDFVQRQMRAYGATRADFAAHEQEIRTGAEQNARERIKARYIMLAIADTEKITVTNDDMYNVLVNHAVSQGRPINKVVEEIKKDQSRLVELQRAVLFEKTVKFLSDNAKVVEAKADATADKK